MAPEGYDHEKKVPPKVHVLTLSYMEPKLIYLLLLGTLMCIPTTDRSAMLGPQFICSALLVGFVRLTLV